MVFKEIWHANGLETVFLIAKYYGLNPDLRWNQTRQALYFLWALLLYLFTTVPMCFEIADAYRHFLAKDYRVVFQIIGISSNAMGYAFVTFSYHRHKDQFFEMMELIKASVTKGYSYAPEIAQRTHPLIERFAKYFLIASIFAYTFMYIGWCSPPVIYYFARLPDTNYSTLPLAYGEQNYGLDKTVPVCFWLILLIQFIHGNATLTGIIFGNTLTPVLCLLLGCQINILKSALTKVSYTSSSKSRKSFTEMHNIPQLEKSPNLKEEKNAKNMDTLMSEKFIDNKDYFRHCIEHHQLIIRIVQKMRLVLAPYLFLVLVTSIISVSNLMITVSMYHSDPLNTFVTIQTGIIFLGLLILETYSLTVLRSNLSDISSALSDSKWLQLRENPEKKRDYLIVSLMSEHEVTFPLILSGNLDFPRLYQIFHLAWNYFQLMNNLGSKLKAQ